MKRLILTLAFLATIATLQVAIDELIRWRFTVEPVVAAAAIQQVSRSDTGPELESATDASAIVRWTCPNPGGTALHYGIVHYGASAVNLTEIARSPNRRNPSNPAMTFRVRMSGLKPHTTYYYTAESVDATGVSDGRSGPVKTFQTM
jgi:phosphodiesterase/alkaline phosphatase D-like protein